METPATLPSFVQLSATPRRKCLVRNQPPKRRSKDRHRQIFQLQESPFLDLPGEIRMEIYGHALTLPHKIDLWPAKYRGDPATEDLKRLQQVIHYISNELTLGLVTTCRQIQRECDHIFWTKNTFRFSADMEWYGAKRFLGLIGPRALSLIRDLEFFAPIDHTRYLDNSAIPDFYRNFASGIDYENNNGLAANIEHICWLLEAASPSLQLTFILPKGFGLQAFYGYGFWRTTSRVYEELHLPDELVDLLPHFTRGFVFSIEAGAYLRDAKPADDLQSMGIDVICQPGSFIETKSDIPDSSPTVTVVMEPTHWLAGPPPWEYLLGVPALFDERERFSVPGRGGKANKRSEDQPGKRRILSGVGGCRFHDRDVWTCEATCPWKFRVKKDQRGGYYWKTICYHRVDDKRGECSVKKQLVLKSWARPKRGKGNAE